MNPCIVYMRIYCFQPTYEELKPFAQQDNSLACKFQPTYEELKPVTLDQ